MSFFRSLSCRFAHSPSSSHTKSSVLSEKVTRPEELSPNIPQDELYVPEETKRDDRSDYIIKAVENNIPLGPESGEEFHLLNKQSNQEHVRKYEYLHIGCVQVAVKPLIREGLNASILMCLRDVRHNKFCSEGYLKL
ncbi:hypothetical protein AHAS_Ahas14G0186000 [Arachis hypogaea]